MKHTTNVGDLQKIVAKWKSQGHSIGFAPTMGALHDGHISLMNASQQENEKTICSIFVNPTQFNEKSDLEKYPRTLEADKNLLEKNQVSLLFSPNVDEVYPTSLKTKLDIDLKGLDEQMEGKFRPGHFEGVLQVVKRLLDIVQPDRLYMGQKDFQQFSLINYMIKYYKLPTSIRVVPIKRETSGLAMSSRNVRLTDQNKYNAPHIYRTLKWCKRNKYKYEIASLEKMAMDKLSKIESFNPEYFMIADGYTLRPITDMRTTKYAVACVAVWAGDVRLIDNIILKKPRDLKIFIKD